MLGMTISQSGSVSIKAMQLIEYCKQDNRFCPLPDVWVKLWKLLPNKVQKGAGYIPSAPLILSGWWYSSDQEKSARLEEHIRWADANGVIEEVDGYLRSLSEIDWYHGGD
jgi:hypothetical protein